VVVTLALGGKRMNVTWWGKCGTFANMCAFPWFLFAHERSWSHDVRLGWSIAAYCVAIPGVIFSLAAAWQYIGLGRRAIAEGRAERAAAI
jgi:phosphatidylglycerophosphate synthase